MMPDGYWLIAQEASPIQRQALAIFVAYTAILFVMGWLCHRIQLRGNFLSEYFLGARGLGTVALTLTFAATSASAGTFAGFPSFVYSSGWILSLWIASYMVVPLCGMGLLGKRLNQVAQKTGAITIPDVLRERFQSPALGLVTSGFIALMLWLYLIPQFKVAGLILQNLLGPLDLVQGLASFLSKATSQLAWLNSVDPEYLACLLLFSVLVVCYTTWGGFRAVVWTDVLQGGVMLVGILLMLGITLQQVGGLSRATEAMSRMTPPNLGEVRFHYEGSETNEEIRIKADTWFLLDPTEAGDGMVDEATPIAVWRTNELAIIHPDSQISRDVKAVRITTPEEIAVLLPKLQGAAPTLPDSVRVEVVDERAYAYGAGKRGVYVSGPGPSETNPNGFLPLGLAFSFFAYWALSGAGQPGNMVRLMATRSATTLRRSMASLAIYFSCIYFPLVIIFCCARVLLPGLDHDPDRIMPEMAFHLSSVTGRPWLAGLLVAAPFAAAMSTVDSFMLMISSSLVRDIYQQHFRPDVSEKTVKRWSYRCTLTVGVLATVAAMNPPQYLQYLIVFAGGALSVTFLLPMALALYWPRMNAVGTMAGMIGGFVAYLSLYLEGFRRFGEASPWRPLQLDPLIWGFLASGICCVVAALCTAPPPDSLVRRFFYRAASESRSVT